MSLDMFGVVMSRLDTVLAGVCVFLKDRSNGESTRGLWLLNFVGVALVGYRQNTRAASTCITFSISPSCFPFLVEDYFQAKSERFHR